MSYVSDKPFVAGRATTESLEQFYNGEGRFLQQTKTGFLGYQRGYITPNNFWLIFRFVCAEPPYFENDGICKVFENFIENNRTEDESHEDFLVRFAESRTCWTGPPGAEGENWKF